MKVIKLTQGRFALVDDKDFKNLDQWNWCFNNGYAVRGQHNPLTQKTEIVLMHRAIVGAKKGHLIDHINNDGLDNRRINLRFADKTINALNAKLRKTNTSGFKGVWRDRDGNWVAETSFKRKKIYIGAYKSKREAAIAFDNKVTELYGDIPLTNKKLGLL